MAIDKFGSQNWAVQKSNTEQMSKDRVDSRKETVKDNLNLAKSEVASKMFDTLKSQQGAKTPSSSETTKEQEVIRDQSRVHTGERGKDTSKGRGTDQTRSDYRTKAEADYVKMRDIGKKFEGMINKQPHADQKTEVKQSQQANKADTQQEIKGQKGIPLGDKSQLAAKSSEQAKGKEKARQSREATQSKSKEFELRNKKVRETEQKDKTETHTKTSGKEATETAKEAGARAAIEGGAEQTRKAEGSKEKTKAAKGKVEKKKAKASKKGGSKVAYTTPDQQRMISGLGDIEGGSGLETSPFDSEGPAEDEGAVEGILNVPVYMSEPVKIDYGETYTNLDAAVNAGDEAKRAYIKTSKEVLKEIAEKVDYEKWPIHPTELKERFVAQLEEGDVQKFLEDTQELVDSIRMNIRVPNGHRGYGSHV